MSFNCAHPKHEGDRFVVRSQDRYQLRVEFRRADGSERPHAKTLTDSCRDCMELDWPIVEHSAARGVMQKAIRLVLDTVQLPEQKGMW